MSSNWRSFWSIALLAVSAVAMSGCVTPEQIDSPSIYLDPDYVARPNPTLVRMKMTNGAGDTIYEGAPNINPLSYDPKDPRFDGTMHVTRTYSDGTVKDQTFTYDVGNPFRLKFNDETRQYDLTEATPITQPKFFGALTPTYEFLNRPDTNIVRRDQGGELAGFVKADNESNNPAFNGQVGFKMDAPFLGRWGRNWGVSLSGSYYSSTAKQDDDVISAGTGALAVFGPLTGGGINFGNNDITGLRYNSDYTAWESSIMFDKDYNADLWDEVVDFHSYFGIEFGKNEDDQTLSGNVPGLGLNFMSGNWIDDWYYGPVGGFDTVWELSNTEYPKVDFVVGGFGKLFVNDLSAKRMISVSNGQNGLDNLSDTEVTLGGGAKIGLNLKVSSRLNVQVGYIYEYANNTPVINVDQQTGDASVDAEGADKHQIYVGVRMAF